MQRIDALRYRKINLFGSVRQNSKKKKIFLES